MAVAEAISRAHAHGEPWRPDDPWRFYPTRDERIAEAFAAMDANVNAQLRQAKAEAARVLRDAGVHAQVVIDSQQDVKSPPVAAMPPGLGGSPGPPPGAASRSGVAARAQAALARWASNTEVQRSRTPTTGACPCVACTREDIHRGDAAAGLPEIVRYANDPGRVR